MDPIYSCFLLPMYFARDASIAQITWYLVDAYCHFYNNGLTVIINSYSVSFLCAILVNVHISPYAVDPTFNFVLQMRKLMTTETE